MVDLGVDVAADQYAVLWSGDRGIRVKHLLCQSGIAAKDCIHDTIGNQFDAGNIRTGMIATHRSLPPESYARKPSITFI